MGTNWRTVKFGDICKINNETYSISENWDFVNYLDTGNITKNVINEFQFISIKNDKLPSRARRKVKNGNIIYSTVRPNQEHYGYITSQPQNFLVSTGFAVIDVNLNLADSKFIYYNLTQREYTNLLQSIAEQSTTTYPSIKSIDIANLKISIPSLSVQKKIAAILSALDDKIELNEKINQNLEAQAQAIFKSWFVDFEPFKNGKFIDSELGKIPEGWEVKELGKVSKNIREKVVSRTNIPVLSAVKEGRLILSEEYFSKQVYSKSLSKYILVKENDYAYNPARVNIGSLGRNTICSLGCVSPVYVVFEIDDNYLAFFDMYFKMESFKNEVKLRASGSVRQTLSYDDFSLIKVVYPPKSVSSNFNKLSAVLFEKIIRNKKESRRLAQLRDTLLPKLMSGEIDVSDVAV